ncbi:hypothetical protein [Phenylobacterium deserti]|uniref:hypothetical protein n=1 Tax=Phenylobacterium deserti TaxID=1914756 RepID=UPI0010582E9D|nr:hypothetical protein [Phenylobacterium deserti]
MADGMADFMGYDPQPLRLTASLGEAVSQWLKQEHPTNTAKTVARMIDCDTRTAENIVAGHLSSVTLTKLLKAYGWSLLSAAGAAVIGETYETSIAREIEDIANERRKLDALETHLRGRYARLRARPTVGSGGLRVASSEDPDAGRSDRRYG